MKAIEFLGIEIYRYGIFYFISFLIAYLFFVLIAKKKIFSGYKNLQNLLDYWIDNLFLAIILWVLFGWRLGYILLYNFEYYFYNPLKIFFVWEGGMSFVGGIVWVSIALWIIKKIYKLWKKDFFLLSDLCLCILPVWIILGRFWNFLNQELYGIKVSWSGLFSENLKKIWIYYVYEKVDSNRRINSNLFELVFEWLVPLLILQFYFWKKYFVQKINPGIITSFFLILYWIARFFAEFLRQYSLEEYRGVLTKTQYIMIVFVLLGIFIFINSKKHE